MNPHKRPGFSSRGYLPHFDPDAIPQTLVFGLADSMPVALISRWKLELEYLQDDERRRELFERAEKYLDRGLGSCYLGIPQIAELVCDAIVHFESKRYLLFAWAVMPNHLHLVLEPSKGIELSDIVHSIKSYTAQQANKKLGRRGAFWQPDYFDRYIRDRQHFKNAIRYVEANPVKAGLIDDKAKWRWSSAYSGVI